MGQLSALTIHIRDPRAVLIGQLRHHRYREALRRLNHSQLPAVTARRLSTENFADDMYKKAQDP